MLLSNLLIGMSCFLLLISVKDSVLSSVHQSSKKYMGADLRIYSRQKINTKKLLRVEKLLPQERSRSKMNELYTMVKGKGRSRLILLTAVDEQFPFYGEFKLEKKGLVFGGQKKSIIGDSRVWVYPEVLKQLNLKIGDSISLGNGEFIIDDVMLEASGQASGWSAMAPLIYLSFESLEKTGLIKKGSTLWQSYLYKIPSTEDPVALEKKIDRSLKSPSLKVESHISSGEQASRLVLYFTDFLGLSGLVVLFLSIIGVYFSFHTFVYNQLKSIAVLKSVGLKSSNIKWIFFLQFLTLSTLAFMISILIVTALLPIMNYYLHELSFFDLSLDLSLNSLWVSLVILLVLAFFLSWPIISFHTQVSVKALFSDQVKNENEFSIKKIFMYSPLALIFGLLSVWIAKSWVTGGVFWLSLIIILFFTAVIWWLLVKVLTTFIVPKPWAWHFKSWLRRPLPALLVFVSISSSVFLVNFLVFIEGRIYNELLFDGAKGRPSLFIFDIQEEQTETLKAIAKKNNFDFNSFAPMIRSKLTKVNDINFEKISEDILFETREREREERFRNRGMNLTYRQKLSPSESIVNGEDYVGVFSGQGLPKISLEKRFAERLNINLNDKLTFEIQGVEVEALVKSIRNIRWTSFEPNFFIQFPLGVLELAPKTFIASTPQLDEKTSEAFLSQLFDEAPNASVIDVGRIINRISGLIRKMSLALKFITFMAMACGLLIIFSISRSQIKQKSKDIVLLKWLGLSQKRLKKIYIIEFTWIAFLSSVLALLMSHVMTLVIGKIVFDSLWWGQSAVPYANILVVSLTSWLVVYLVINKIFNIKTKSLESI